MLCVQGRVTVIHHSRSQHTRTFGVGGPFGWYARERKGKVRTGRRGGVFRRAFKVEGIRILPSMKQMCIVIRYVCKTDTRGSDEAENGFSRFSGERVDRYSIRDGVDGGQYKKRSRLGLR
jgi:hypothetical protein